MPAQKCKAKIKLLVKVSLWEEKGILSRRSFKEFRAIVGARVLRPGEEKWNVSFCIMYDGDVRWRW